MDNTTRAQNLTTREAGDISETALVDWIISLCFLCVFMVTGVFGFGQSVRKFFFAQLTNMQNHSDPTDVQSEIPPITRELHTFEMSTKVFESPHVGN